MMIVIIDTSGANWTWCYHTQTHPSFFDDVPDLEGRVFGIYVVRGRLQDSRTRNIFEHFVQSFLETLSGLVGVLSLGFLGANWEYPWIFRYVKGTCKRSRRKNELA
jgi:hypothetical protein